MKSLLILFLTYTAAAAGLASAALQNIHNDNNKKITTLAQPFPLKPRASTTFILQARSPPSSSKPSSSKTAYQPFQQQQSQPQRGLTRREKGAWRKATPVFSKPSPGPNLSRPSTSSSSGSSSGNSSPRGGSSAYGSRGGSPFGSPGSSPGGYKERASLLRGKPLSATTGIQEVPTGIQEVPRGKKGASSSAAHAGIPASRTPSGTSAIGSVSSASSASSSKGGKGMRSWFADKTRSATSGAKGLFGKFKRPGKADAGSSVGSKAPSEISASEASSPRAGSSGSPPGAAGGGVQWPLGGGEYVQR